MAKDPKQDPRERRIDPEQQVISPLQAKRLADLSGYPVEKIQKRKLGELHKDLRLYLDPHLLLFRRICGQVVRRNPETGALEGVPNATVHVEDTDCSFMIYSPPGWPNWSWFFPFKCKREELAHAVTDECGHFCVWVPAWEIDWIVKWRKARLCFPTLFRPRLKDYLERIVLPELLPEPPRIRWPRPPEATPITLPSAQATPIEIPHPKPDPYVRDLSIASLATVLSRPDAQARMREVAGDRIATTIEQLTEGKTFGANSARLEAELQTPVIPLPPPLPDNMDMKSARLAIDTEISDDFRKRLGEIDFQHWVGPFWRCIDVVFGVWTPVFDVPDITFKVTQDIDGDGNEEVIYSEGFFDVRWNAGAMSDVVLEADPSALSSPNCEGPEIDPGACSQPEIVTAGLMPLKGAHFDLTTGYAKYVNRARSGGLSTSPRDTVTTAPMCNTVQLHGCHRFPGAVHYRIVKKHQTATTFTPVLGETWTAAVLSGPPLIISPDADGWYPVLPAANLVFPYWLLNWRTWRDADGRYDMKLQLGDGSKTVIDESAAVPIQIDNSDPSAVFDAISWRYAGGGGWTTLPVACPVIRRIPGANIEIRVQAHVSAKHFRNASLFGTGCDSTALPKLDGQAAYDNWHTGPTDNAWSTTARFQVSGALDDGAYTFGIDAYGRPFNPAGGDNGPSSGWDYDWVYARHTPRRHIAIVDL